MPDVATSATALHVRSGSAKCWYAASRAGRAIQNPILPNIRLASLNSGTLRQVLRTGAFNQAAQKLLDDAPADFSLEEDGPRYVGPDTAALAWRLGPPGSPVARGIDTLTIRDGRVSILRTLIAAETDA